MEQVKRQVYERPQIIEWIQQNPDAPELERINRFGRPGADANRYADPPMGSCAPIGKITPNLWLALLPEEPLPAIQACLAEP